MNIDDLLRTTVERGASDLILRADSPTLVRVNGRLETLTSEALTPEEVSVLTYACLSPAQQARFEAEYELDFAYALPEVARFRANLYRQRGQTQSVFHVIPWQTPTMEGLHLPPVCQYFAERPRGLVLVSGATGSGKSTTLAAMLDYINRHFSLHILTVEDPIEFVHQPKEAVITRRELGYDTHSLDQALHAALRQDADVLLVSSLHKAEIISLALTAAETGHLVFAAVPATDAVQTLDFLLDAFPPHQQARARMQLAGNLVGVVSQTLVHTKDGLGRLAAFEILVGVPTVRSLIREGKTHQIGALIQTGAKQGMMTRDHSLAQMVNQGRVTFEAAREVAHNLTEFHFLCTDGPTVAEEPPVSQPSGKPTVRLSSPDGAR